MKTIVMTRGTFFPELILALAIVGTIAPPASAQENKDGREGSDPAAQESGVSRPNPFDDTWKFALGAPSAARSSHSSRRTLNSIFPR
jgi:hypothetical protein